MIKPVNRFPDDLKRKIVEEYLTTNQTQYALRRKYNIGGKSAILKWMRKFGISQPTQQQVDIHRLMNKESTSKTIREIQLEERIKELEKSLETECFKTKALNTMIDIIERDLKIPVRKKSGTKQ